MILLNQHTHRMYQPELVEHHFTVFPDDLSETGNLFGGRLLAEMDVVALKSIGDLLDGTRCNGLVTIGLSKINFQEIAHLGDVIHLQAIVSHLHGNSIEVSVKVDRETAEGQLKHICEAKLSFVSLRNSEPFPHHRIMNEYSKN